MLRELRPVIPQTLQPSPTMFGGRKANRVGAIARDARARLADMGKRCVREWLAKQQ